MVPLFHTPPDQLFPGFALELTQRLHRNHLRVKAGLPSQTLLDLCCPGNPQGFLPPRMLPLEQTQLVPFLHGRLIDLQASCGFRRGEVTSVGEP